MALFKPLVGGKERLNNTELHEGYVYFCDDGSLFFDYKDEHGVLQRKQINAKDAETLFGATLVNKLTNSELEIPTGAAVMHALENFTYDDLGAAPKALIVFDASDGIATHSNIEIIDHYMAGGIVVYSPSTSNHAAYIDHIDESGNVAFSLWKAVSVGEDTSIACVTYTIDANKNITTNTNVITGKDNLPSISIITDSVVVLTLDNNVEYQCINPVASLTIDGFTAGNDNQASIWSLQFVAGDNITVIMPETVKWAIAEPVFITGINYLLSFVPLVSGEILGVWVSNE